MTLVMIKHHIKLMKKDETLPAATQDLLYACDEPYDNGA